MAKELLTLFGQTNGTATTGTFQLSSDLIYATGTAPYTAPSVVVIPVGMKAKIWFEEVSGAPVTVTLNFSKNATASTPTWTPIDSVTLASTGELDLEKRRPHVIRSITGQEGFMLSWSQSAAGVSYVAIGVEITDDEE